jgi:hypothetical protein
MLRVCRRYGSSLSHGIGDERSPPRAYGGHSAGRIFTHTLHKFRISVLMAGFFWVLPSPAETGSRKTSHVGFGESSLRRAGNTQGRYTAPAAGID